MYNTYKLLAPLMDYHYYDLSLEELAEEYKISSNSKILAVSFDKIYKIALVIKNQYWGLLEDDIASYCLQTLDTALKTYDEMYKTRFVTYFCKIFSNKLREETENLNRKKRKCILESIHDLIDIGVEDTYNLIEMLLPKTLTKNEYKLCLLESEGYSKKECAEILGVSRMTIHNWENSLKIKLADLQY